eukprot:Amastigsp_a842343_221.p2 type:complete len:114 gc:universal Amastigsp_a842343_221:814-473(-)
MALPDVCAKVASSETTWSAVSESRPEVGSSRNNSDGLTMRELAMLTRLRSPPEIPRCRPGSPIGVFMHRSRLRNLRVVSTRSLRSASEMPPRCMRAVKSTCSYGVSSLRRISS